MITYFLYYYYIIEYVVYYLSQYLTLLLCRLFSLSLSLLYYNKVIRFILFLLYSTVYVIIVYIRRASYISPSHFGASSRWTHYHYCIPAAFLFLSFFHVERERERNIIIYIRFFLIIRSDTLLENHKYLLTYIIYNGGF